MMTNARPLTLVPIVPAPEPELQTTRVFVDDDDTIVVETRTVGREARCPVCDQPATRVQSRYRRTLSDLAAQGIPVRVRVEVRRFRCTQPSCTRRIFTERLAPFAVPYARRTTRLTKALTRVGMVTGGEVGARLLPALGLSASPATLLRLVHRAVVPPTPTPRVLGVDDWARRRGHTYGTILVDLERRVPVDLLDERTSETLSTWLQVHPGVEIISRDRAGAYAMGARTGAPNAQQVADRWHLLKNVGEVLERVLRQHRRAIDDAVSLEGPQAADAKAVAPTAIAAVAAGDSIDPTLPTVASASVSSAPDSPSSVSSASGTVTAEGPRSAREVAFEQVHALHATGLSIRAVTKRLGLSRITVRKYLRAEHFPARGGRRGPSPSLSRWDGHLRSRWAEGCTNARVLWDELQAQGFRGSKRALREYVSAWRTTSGAANDNAQAARPRLLRPSAQQVRWWLTVPETDLEPHQRTFVTRLVEACPAVREGQRLTWAFIDMVESRDPAQLVPWLEAAEASGVASFRDFAIGLRQDFEAVRAALTSPWSNGQTEGQVTKVKLLKRQGYGRASLHLLRQRLLCAA